MRKSISTTIVFALSAVLIFISTAAFSEEQYRSEVSIYHQRTDYEFGGRALDNGVSAAFFLEPVKTGDHPYAEAAFLEKIGSWNLSAGQTDYRAGTVKGDGPYFEAALNYTTPDFPLVITPSFGMSSSDYTGSFLAGMDNNYYGLAVGKFLSYGLFARVGYSYSKTTYDYIPAPDENSIYHAYYLYAKYVKETGGGTAINLETSLTRVQFSDDISSGNLYPFSFAVDYYFARSFSAGVGIQVVNDDSSDGKTYSANIKNFITPSLFLQASYDHYLDDQDGQFDYKNFTLTASARF
jgi:hypothetical protein